MLAQVAMYMNKDIISSTALFRGCSITLVASLVEYLNAHRCLPLDRVIRRGDVGEELYLIKRGLFEVLNEDETVHRMRACSHAAAHASEPESRCACNSPSPRQDARRASRTDHDDAGLRIVGPRHLSHAMGA